MLDAGIVELAYQTRKEFDDHRHMQLEVALDRSRIPPRSACMIIQKLACSLWSLIDEVDHQKHYHELIASEHSEPPLSTGHTQDGRLRGHTFQK